MTEGLEPDANEDEVAPTAEPATRAGVVALSRNGSDQLFPGRDEYLDLMWRLRDEEGFAMLTDLCAVDYLTHPGRTTLPAGVEPERFEVVVQLLSMARAERLTVRVQIPADDPTLVSVYDVYPSADALEREVADMFGITFEGHPDPNRILMPEDWEGHPLRKDYAVGRIPVQFKAPQGDR